MSALWTATEAAAATGGRSSADWKAFGVSIDSRTLSQGDLFIAIQGPQHDGHDFIHEAFAKGAAAVIAHKNPAAAAGPVLKTADTYKALLGLARAARKRTPAQIAAITGSAGKTGAKDGLACALEGQGVVHAAAASYNNRWGLPLSLARMPAEARFAVFEIGMNHAGEIRPLAQLARPDIAIVTNVGPVHLAFFDSVAGIARAKAEIFEGLAPGGAVVLNRDDESHDFLQARARACGAQNIASFGSRRDSDARLISCTHEADGGLRAEAEIFGRALSFRLSFGARPQALNMLAVLAAVSLMGADPARAAGNLARLTPAPGRGRTFTLALKTGGTALLIDETYNANPLSVAAALDALAARPLPPGARRIAVLGDMRELGEEAPALHAGLAPALRRAGVDRLFVCGEMMAHLFRAAPAPMRGAEARKPEDLAAPLRNFLRSGDAVMIKGSRAIGLERLTAALAGEASP